MVQNFAVFVDRLATAEIKTSKISMGGENDDASDRNRVLESALLGLCVYAVSGPGRRSLSVGKYKV